MRIEQNILKKLHNFQIGIKIIKKAIGIYPNRTMKKEFINIIKSRCVLQITIISSKVNDYILFLVLLSI
jgi:hypothetical protein